MKRVLFVAYAFPPVGGAGVQRTTKFVKYLPSSGWLASVLTVANPSVPAWDQSLLQDIPPQVSVHRARTWEPGYAAKANVSGGNAARGSQSLVRSARNVVQGVARGVLQPDAQILWLFNAIRAGRRILDQNPHDAIIVSGPPFSTFLVGASLSKHSGLPLVLDYRDEWDISNAYWENKKMGRLSHWVQSRMQRSCVCAARALIATTKFSAVALEGVRDSAGSSATVTWIYNGFDSADFADRLPLASKSDGVYRLAYIGTLWNLTSVAPLVGAVQELCAADPPMGARLELVFAGRRTPEQSQLLERLNNLPCRLVEHPYVDHHKALEMMKSVDGLCALLSDVPEAARVVPAKIFEYMASGRSVLGIAPAGEMTDILKQYPAAFVHAPSDISGIASSLKSEIARVQASRPLELGEWNPESFDRRSEAAELGRLLDAVTAATNPAAS